MRLLEILLKLASPRVLLSLGLLAGAAYLAVVFQHVPVQAYLDWRYPPQQAAPAEGKALMDQVELARARKLERRYREVLAKIDAAERRGLRVDGLREKAGVARSLKSPSLRLAALRMLSEVEMAIPRKKTAVVPAGPSDEREEILPDVKPARAAAPKAARRRAP